MSIDPNLLPPAETGIEFMGVATISLERLAIHNWMVRDQSKSLGSTVFAATKQFVWDQHGRGRHVVPNSARVLAVLSQASPEPQRPSAISYRLMTGFKTPIYRTDSWTLDGINDLNNQRLIHVERTKFKNHRKISSVQLTTGLLVPEGYDEPPIMAMAEMPNIDNISIETSVLADAVSDLRLRRQPPTQD